MSQAVFSVPETKSEEDCSLDVAVSGTLAGRQEALPV